MVIVNFLKLDKYELKSQVFYLANIKFSLKLLNSTVQANFPHLYHLSPIQLGFDPKSILLAVI